MKHYPYAIFDMDGTLIDSMPFWAHLGRDYLISLGKDPEPGLRRILEPMSTLQSANYLRDNYHIDKDIPVIQKEMNAVMEKHYRTDIPAKAGVREYLEKLRAQGVKMYICSATARPLVEAVLTRLGLRDYFSDITSCDEVGVGKTEPDVFLLALKRMGAKPEEAVMYEDAFFAMKTAKSVGLTVVGVYDESCPNDPAEVAAFCDGYVRDFSRLPEELL